MGSARISDVIIDCVDPEGVAAFWSGLLERAIGGRKGPYVWLEPVDGEVNLSFQLVSAPPRAAGRTHVDVTVPDVYEAARRAESLGGRRAVGYESGGFLVMEDPEGNIFCLIPNTRFGLDDDGRADYLDAQPE